MLNNGNRIAEEYFNGKFDYSPNIEAYIPHDRFHALQGQFTDTFDDFYHDYFTKQGECVDANKALIRIAFSLFKNAYGHLPLAYKNCAISSGTWAHLDAVAKNYHTTDRLSRVVGGDWHGRTIKDNAQRSLERIERIRGLNNEAFFIAPTMFEGSTRAFINGFGKQLTSIPFQAEEYMAFWNMVIDTCQSFVLDDINLDTPSSEQVLREIESIRSGVARSAPRPLLQTSDWANSRNSIYEMARANYIRFGMHPLRPDAKMDMRIYDQDTNLLYPARLIDTLKPVLQNILRWSAQGIATDSACTTAARIIHLHRMRTDEVYNRMQPAPLNLNAIDQALAKPSRDEKREFQILIDRFEPLLLNYLPHLIRTEGLPIDYKYAQDRHALRPHAKGDEIVKWQRAYIPLQYVMDLWDLTLPRDFNPRKSCRVKSLPAHYRIPQRRQHDFETQPFALQENEIWPDNPFEKLDPMFQQLAKSHIGVLEIIAQNNLYPDYHGIYRDLKRGDVALQAAKQAGITDLSLLPGALGKNFAQNVRHQNLAEVTTRFEEIQCDGRTLVFGTPIINDVNFVINSERRYFNGPGPNATPSDYRLAMMMEMLRRNLTSIEFSSHWETSEDESRLMMLATKMEFGGIDRPGLNNTEIKVINESGEVIPFAERIKRIHMYLTRLKDDPIIQRSVQDRDEKALEGYGVRYISLTLARMIEIYDCLKDQEYNQGRFEIRLVQNLSEFSKDIDDISPLRAEILKTLREEWCWLWNNEDLVGLRQEYRDHWYSVHGRQSQFSGRDPTLDSGLRHEFGPR